MTSSLQDRLSRHLPGPPGTHLVHVCMLEGRKPDRAPRPYFLAGPHRSTLSGTSAGPVCWCPRLCGQCSERSHSPHRPGVAGGGGGSQRGAVDPCRHTETHVLSSDAASQCLGGPHLLCCLPSPSWPAPSQGAGGRPRRPPLHQQRLLSCPRVSQPTSFPLPGACSWQSALGQACLLPRLPVCPSLFFVSFLLLNVLAYLTWLWVGMSMGVCVCETEREHVSPLDHNWILGISHTWYRGMCICWGSQAQMWRSGE